MSDVHETLARDIEAGNRMHQAESVKVTVTHGIQVVHEGERYTDGATVEVPGPVAHKWIRAGWVSVSDETPDEKGRDDGVSDAESPRGGDRKDAQRRAGGTARAGTRRG